jgi:hypothetical protein
MRVPLLSHPRATVILIDPQRRPLPCSAELYHALVDLQTLCEKRGLDIPVLVTKEGASLHVPLSLLDFQHSYFALQAMNPV